MEHKPWAALDGEEWLAAFKREGDRGDVAAELAVGADLSFELPRPAGGGRKRKAAPKRSANGAAAAAKATQPARSSRDDALERRLAEAERARGEAVAEAQALRRALEQKERTARELQGQLEAAEAERAAAPVGPDKAEPNAEL